MPQASCSNRGSYRPPARESAEGRPRDASASPGEAVGSVWEAAGVPGDGRHRVAPSGDGGSARSGRRWPIGGWRIVHGDAAPARTGGPTGDPAPASTADGPRSMAPWTVRPGATWWSSGAGSSAWPAAWRAAGAGATVAVVDPDEPGHGATWAAAGMLAPVGEAHFGEEPLAALTVAAARAWPAFARRARGRLRAPGRLPADGDARWSPSTPPTGPVRRRPRPSSSHLGLDGPTAHRRRVPGASSRSSPPASRGGAAFAGDHQVDNRAGGGRPDGACRAAGVATVPRPGRPRSTSAGRPGHRASTAGTAGTLAAGRVVLAAGAGPVRSPASPPVRCRPSGR